MTDYPKFRRAQRVRGPYYQGEPIPPPERRSATGFIVMLAGVIVVGVAVGVFLGWLW